MIPDIAVIISAYAVARLLNEYVVTGDGAQQARLIIGIIAVAIIGLFLFSVIDTGSGLNLNGL